MTCRRSEVMGMQLTLEFSELPKRLLWEFDLGELHFMVSQDEAGDLWLDARPVEKKRKRVRG